MTVKAICRLGFECWLIRCTQDNISMLQSLWITESVLWKDEARLYRAFSPVPRIRHMLTEW